MKICNMKLSAAFIFFLMCFNTLSFTQTGADYYMPLSVGNYLTLRCYGTSGNWSDRDITYHIENTDFINGVLHYREVGLERSLNNSDSSIFRVFWLRKDVNGNIIVGAMGSSTNPDSATITNYLIFPNEFLTLGFRREFIVDGILLVDSVLSINETVVTSAGTFTNCLKIQSEEYDNTGLVIMREIQYYALNIGIVKVERLIKNPHYGDLYNYNIVSSVNNESEKSSLDFILNQNYPNPFNPTTTIEYVIASPDKSEKQSVLLKIYNVLGNEVATLVNEEKSPGKYEVRFNAADLPSGVYFYQLTAGVYSSSKKLIVLK